MAGDEPRSDGSTESDLGDGDVQERANALVERGLSCYGVGDLTGALSAWELAITLAPGDARATQFIDYVNDNYKILNERFEAARAVEKLSDDLEIPFGVEDMPSGRVSVDGDE